MSGVLNKNYIYIDFEFSDSNEETLKLTSCSWKINDGRTRHVWLYNDKQKQKELAEYFTRFKDSHIFVAYASTAECRSFLSLGLDPSEFKWIDLYFEHRQLTHTYNEFKYGTYFSKTGAKMHSVPPSYDPKKNIGKDNNAVGMGYVDACGVCLGVYVDSARKREMRDLILAQKDEYTEQEQQDIMLYCDDDIKYLPDLHKVQTQGLWRGLAQPDPNLILQYQLTRGQWSASLAKMEQVGFPIRVDRVKNLRRNYELAKDSIISDLCENYYPFYVLEKKRKRDLKGTWKKKSDLFEKFIDECESIPWDEEWQWKGPGTPEKRKKWPVSEKTHKYKTDEKTLEKWDGIPEIKAFRQANKLIGQLKWFQEPKEGEADFMDNVGSDGRLRAFLGAYGTQTGRNAPKAKNFVLAMSAWLRCLIQPKEGEAIIGIDYASQEFIIAAWLSQDPEMIQAYKSGDPYLYFAKKAGAVPPDADPKKCKNPNLVLKKQAEIDGVDISHGVPESYLKDLQNDDPEIYKEYITYCAYAESRDLFKATTLGLQYGMREESLALKLTADTGRYVSIREAEDLIKMHEKLYKVFWNWIDKEWKKYQRTGFLTLWDGWSLLPNNDNSLSVKNVPVQGTGAVIMREACKLYQKQGGKIMAPLHDAIYATCKESEVEYWTDLLSECMQLAVEMVLGKVDVRQDIDIHRSDEDWVEKKGQKYYNQLKQYLEHIDTEEDMLRNIKMELYGGLGVY